MNLLLITRWRVRIFLLLFFASGCARPLPPEVSLPLRSEVQLQTQLEAITSRYQSLQSSARIAVVTAKDTFTANQVLFVERPARLRSEVLFGPFATPVLSLSINEAKISVYQPLKGTFAEGSASVANIARYTRMPLRAEDLIGMILVAPPLFSFEKASVSRVAAGDRLDLVATGGVEQHFTFDPAGNLLQAVYLLAGRLQLQADYSEFDPQQDNFPRKLQVSMPERQVVATMNFSDSTINEAIPLKNFILKIPAGIKVQNLP